MQARQHMLFGLLLLSMLSAASVPAAAQESFVRPAGGLTVYLGIVPAEIVKGLGPHRAEPPMHGRIPRGPHQYHVVAAIFDAKTNARIEDVAVTAQISGLGLSGAKVALDPMPIANTITYGAFFNLPGADLYTVKLTIQRPGYAQPVNVEFKYDHRRKSARAVDSSAS
jgi:hypothetical protein